MTPAVLSYRELTSISRSDPQIVPDFGQVGEVGRIRPADLIPFLEMRAQEQRVTYWETIWGGTELREHVWWVPLPSSPRDQSTIHTHQVPPLTRDAQGASGWNLVSQIPLRLQKWGAIPDLYLQAPFGHRDWTCLRFIIRACPPHRPFFLLVSILLWPLWELLAMSIWLLSLQGEHSLISQPPITLSY